jgi:ABC-type amino acid transport substrate-binding protein
MRKLFVFLALSVAVSFGLAAQTDDERALRVGTKEAPPFAIKHKDGTWSGLSIDLWKGIAADLGVQYELVETDLDGLLTGLEDGSLDASVAALNVTAERETRFDFSHPFHTSGYGIAIRSERKVIWIEVMKRLASGEFVKALSTLAGLLFVAGFLVWLVERRRNPEQFGGSVPRGIWEGFWWSAVTMTTVGYGDRYPLSAAGRVIALVWMFTSVVIVSSFTAAIASSLTIGSLDERIRSLDDLAHVRVASVPNSTSAAFLDARGISWIPHQSVEAAMAALSDRNVDAVFYDEPLIRHVIRHGYQESLMELPGTITRLDYAIGLPHESDLRESINQSLLTRISSSAWRETLERYLGR